VKRYIGAALAIAATSFLAACGGGGGGGGFTPGPAPSPSQKPNATAAQGTLVDDPSGTPLAGVEVRLAPWTSYPTPGPSPAPILTTTTDGKGRFTISAPNGTYMLVIGSDDNTDTTRPTIHDKVVLAGQTMLAAPTMPPVPGITPAPVETNGDYRLVTIDQTHELPCIQEYDAQRKLHGLANPVIDEWLTENVRAWVNQSVTAYNKQADPKNQYGFLTTGNATGTGGINCAFIADAAFTNAAATYAMMSPWYAGSYLPYQQGSPYTAYGASEFPTDPRLGSDPNAVSWP